MSHFSLTEHAVASDFTSRLKELVKKFGFEVRNFSRANWWIYIVYFILLGVILVRETDNFLSVFTITSIHFVADVFIMMMFSAYSAKEYSKGTYFQITSLLLFLSLKVYTGFIGDGWHYLAADPIYILAAFKNYKKDVEQVHVSYINFTTTSLLSLIIVLAVLMPLKLYFEVKLLSSVAQVIQSFGIFLFAIALSTTENERLRYKLSIIALTAMVGGSTWETVNSFIDGKIVALALSYSLLPFTVLIFYLKSWSYMMYGKK